MRTEQEMLELILHVAENDPRVRAVAMNGSRTNSKVPKDHLRDYDIVYLVTNMESFVNDSGWINVFGERIIMQTPENMSLFPPELGGRFTYLMLFEDGNRIDLMLIPIEESAQYCSEDSLTMILLDKDHGLPQLPPPTDHNYWIEKPSAAYFADCCNEFWWVSTYVAKGLWRKEILYAYDHLNQARDMLLLMLNWKIGIETNFSVSTGKNNKYIQNYLDEDTWIKLMKTYPPCDYIQIEDALFETITLFDQTAIEVATKLQFFYPFDEVKK